MRFSKKIKLFTITLLTVVLSLLSIVKWCVLPALRTPTIPLSHKVGANCNALKKALELYYSKLSCNIPSNPVDGFIDFLIDNDIDSSYSKERPVKPYTSKLDISFYLLLPSELESHGLLLIGYTSPFTEKTGEVYHYALFLQEREISIWKLQPGKLKDIVGKDIFEKKKPDFYFWNKRSRYLQEKSAKKDKKTEENGN